MSIVGRSDTDFSLIRWLRHPLAADAGLLTAAQVGVGVLSLAASVAAARILGPSGYGRSALIIAFAMLIWSAVGVKAAAVCTRYIAIYLLDSEHDRVRAVCKLGYLADAASAVLALLIVFGATFIDLDHLGVEDEAAGVLATILAASFVLSSLAGTSGAVLTGMKRFRLVAGLQLWEGGITAGCVIGALALGFGVSGVVIGTALGHAIAGLTSFSFAERAMRRQGFGRWWTSDLALVAPLRNELLAFFGWNYVVVTLSGAVVQLPLLLLGAVAGPRAAGYYRAATSMMVAGAYIENALGRIAHPTLAQKWAAGKPEELRATLSRWLRQAGLPAGLLLLLLVPALPIVVRLLYGDLYRPMIGGAQLLLVSAAVSVTFFYVIQFFYASGQVKLWAFAMAIFTVTLLAAGTAGIMAAGFTGLAFAVAACRAMFFPLSALLADRGLRRRA